VRAPAVLLGVKNENSPHRSLSGGCRRGVITGAYGGWMIDWMVGNTVTAEIDRCYKYYGTVEMEHFRCEGYWRRPMKQETVIPTRCAVLSLA
jgi:hypothetical protein